MRRPDAGRGWSRPPLSAGASARRPASARLGSGVRRPGSAPGGASAMNCDSLDRNSRVRYDLRLVFSTNSSTPVGQGSEEPQLSALRVPALWQGRRQQCRPARFLQDPIRETPTIPLPSLRKDVFFDKGYTVLPSPASSEHLRRGRGTQRRGGKQVRDCSCERTRMEHRCALAGEGG